LFCQIGRFLLGDKHRLQACLSSVVLTAYYQVGVIVAFPAIVIGFSHQKETSLSRNNPGLFEESYTLDNLIADLIF
jgi:hypothetical protein